MHLLVILVHRGVPLCLHSESIMAELHHQFSHHNSGGCLEWQIMWQQSKRRASAFHNNEAEQAPFPRVKFTLELEVGLCKIPLMCWRKSCHKTRGADRRLCLQAEEKKYELMGGCGQQRFLQENEGESGPRCLTDVVYCNCYCAPARTTC